MNEEAPDFTRDDIVRLFAATYLPLCRALHAAGALEPRRLAARVLARLGDERDAPWALLALSLIEVLLRDAEDQAS